MRSAIFLRERASPTSSDTRTNNPITEAIFSPHHDSGAIDGEAVAGAVKPVCQQIAEHQREDDLGRQRELAGPCPEGQEQDCTA
jgi:hypothetical protein